MPEIKALTTAEGVLALRAMEKKLESAEIDLVQAAKDMETVVAQEINALPSCTGLLRIVTKK